MPKLLEIYLWCVGIATFVLAINGIGNYRRYNRAERKRKDRNSLRLISGLLAIVLLSGCQTLRHNLQPPVSEAIGTVISVEGDDVLVAFEVINKVKGSQATNWFYCPKHQFRKGDRYPDPAKYIPINP